MVRLALVALLLAFVGCQTVQGHDDGRAWSAAEPVGRRADAALEQFRPDVAVDAEGNALAVWDQANPAGIDENIWANYYSAQEESWGTAELIENTDTGPALFPRIAIHTHGDAVVVWQQVNEEGVRDIWSNRYTREAGWGTEERIDNGSGDARFPHVAMDPSGTAVAVWYQSDGDYDSVYSSRLPSNGVWSDATTPIEDEPGDAWRPQIAVDAVGAVAVWQHAKENRSVVFANSATADGTWLGERPIDFATGGPAEQPHVATDGSGNAIAVWRQFDGTRYNIWFNRYTANWGAAGVIETPVAGDASTPQIAMGSTGTGVAVWSQFDGVNYDVWANRYRPGAGWGTPERIGASDRGEALNPRVAMDAHDGAVAVWTQPDGPETAIWSNRYTEGSGWGVAERIDAADVGSAESPRVATDPDGNAIATWVQFVRGTEQVWSGRLQQRAPE